MLTVGQDTYASLDDMENILIDYVHGPYIESPDTLAQEGHARSATLFLDHAYSWLGTRSVAGQALQWPRIGVLDRDGLWIPSDVVPREIITSQALLMQAASLGPLDGGSGGQNGQIVVRESADDASIKYAAGSAARRFPQVSALVRHLTVTHTLGPFRQIAIQRG